MRALALALALDLDLDSDLDLFLFLFLSFLSPTLVILAFFTIYVARLTREATKDEKVARAKVGRLWLEFVFVVEFGLVVVAIQSVLQEKIAARSDYFNAVSQLGSLSPAVRISGIDYLNKTCMGKRKKLHPDKCKKKDTIELLNNHVKFFTQSKSYHEDFAEKPSGDIDRIIEILGGTQGPSNIRWEGAYLRGANLVLANLQGADLLNANLQETYLYIANLQRARLFRANLQRARLQGAELQGVNLYEAKLQGAELQGAELQGAELQGAELQGADLDEANLQGANLYEANLQGANLQGANLQGAELQRTELQGVNLYEAHLQGADLYESNLQGAYSEYEDSPVDFCMRINSRVGKRAEIEGKEKNVLFSGGITEELGEEMNKTQWHNEKIKKHFLLKIESHLNKDPIYTIPDEVKNTVNTGTLTGETAIEIIKEYNESLTDEQARCELP